VGVPATGFVGKTCPLITGALGVLVCGVTGRASPPPTTVTWLAGPPPGSDCGSVREQARMASKSKAMINKGREMGMRVRMIQLILRAVAKKV
jgi:hypothetical protein